MQAHLYPSTVYLSAPEMIRLVRRKGLSDCIAGVADRIEREFLRWNEFDKSARLASHSVVSVSSDRKRGAPVRTSARTPKAITVGRPWR